METLVLALFFVLCYCLIMCKDCSLSVWLLLGAVHAEIRGSVCAGVMGSCGHLKVVVGVFIASGDLKACRRSSWGRWLSRHSGGYCWCTLRKCRTVQLCLSVLLCFVSVVFAYFDPIHITMQILQIQNEGTRTWDTFMTGPCNLI